MEYLIPNLLVFRVLKILHRKYSRKILRKFPGKFFIQRSSRAKGGHQKTWWPPTSIGARPTGGAAPPMLIGAPGVLSEKCPRSSPSSSTRPGIFRKKFPCWLGSQFLISKFRQPFSDLFGGIAPWCVTLPLFQLVFELMLYLGR
jgi:hypothetical protein